MEWALTSCQNLEQLIYNYETTKSFARLNFDIKSIIYLTLLFGIIYVIKFKPESPVKLFISLSFLFYLLNVIRISLFPMPIDSEYIDLLKREISCGIVEARRHNIELFDFMKWDNLFHYTTIGNFFMLGPLGFYLPYTFKNKRWNIIKITFVGFTCSLLIELFQLSYSQITDFIYRGFNVDDLMLNTLGVMCVYLLYKMICFLIKFGNKIIKSI